MTVRIDSADRHQPYAAVLSGSLGCGHQMMAEAATGVLERLGWRTRTLDSMTLLGPLAGEIGERAFRRLMTTWGLYDGLHFAHLRTGSRLADLLDRLATRRLVPALRAEVARDSPDLILSVFATGASAAAKIKPEAPHRHTVVLCTDVAVHRLWTWEGTDLFLVTSPAAAASVRRYLPRACVAVVPPPVRPAFYRAPEQAVARRALDVPAHAPCVVMVDSGWGLGSLSDTAQALAAAGVHVLAVAGHNASLHRRLQALSTGLPTLHPFGFTDRIPEMMAASDVVVTFPGAVTCSEARVVGRQLVLVDAMPGHGRDNLQHELEHGAEVCNPEPAAATGSILAAVSRAGHPPGRNERPIEEWDEAFVSALSLIGVEVRRPTGTAERHAAG